MGVSSKPADVRMHYNQSWMGYGFVGGLQAGAIAAAIGFLVLLLMHWVVRKQGWSHGQELSVAYLLSLLPSASGDVLDLVYFNYAQLQSLDLLRAKLAEVHDPDDIGTRVLCELLGAGVGVFAAWLLIIWRAHARKDRN